MSEGKPESEYRAVRMAEKWKAKQWDYEQQHKATIRNIYIASLLVTLGLAYYTYENAISGNPCPGSWVRDSLWLVLLMHFTNIVQQVCWITGLDNFFCSGLCNLCLDLYEIGVLIFMMNQLSDSTHCLDTPDTVSVYYCLLVNAIVYWVFFIISWFIKVKSCCASPSNEEIEKEVDAEEKMHAKNKMV